MAYQVCRLCFGKGIHLTMLDTEGNSLRKKLSACVPEINISIINNPLICGSCIDQLDAAYKFREKCLLTEKQINTCVKNLYLKSIEHFHDEDTEASNSQQEESCISPNSLNTYLNMSILEGLAEAANKNEDLEVAEVGIGKLKTEQIQPCSVQLIDCLEEYSVTNCDTERNTLNGCKELKIKEMPNNKCDAEQDILKCLDGKDIFNWKGPKRLHQKEKDENNPLKAKQIKLIDVTDSKQANKMQNCEQNNATKKKLKQQTNKTNIYKPVTGCRVLTESQKIGPSKAHYQNGRNPMKITNSCEYEAENTLTKQSPKMKTVAYKKYMPYKRGKAAVNTTVRNNRVQNNIYAKVYKNRRLSESVFEVKTKIVDFQSQREIAPRKELPKNSSFESKIVNKNKRLQNRVTAEIKKPEDFTTPVNCNKTKFYVNNLCHMCNIVINNVDIWKKHIRDHIFTQ